MVTDKWRKSKERRPANYYSMDAWHGSLGLTRQYLKGWNIQKMGQQKKKKQELTQSLDQIDKEAENRNLSAEEWRHRYDIEAELEEIYRLEEIHWQQRVGDRWIVKGDSNTDFFHQYAKGRRRKSMIISLEADQGEIRGQEEIVEHILTFYKNLFGPNAPRDLRLVEDFWVGHRQLTEHNRESLPIPFMEAEIRDAILGMKSNLAPGPNGFGASFFKNFWETDKADYTEAFS